QRTWDNLEKSRAFLQAVDPELQALQAALAQLSTTIDEVEPSPGAYAKLGLELASLWREARELSQTLEDAGATPADLRALATRTRGTIDHARASVARVRAAADALMKDLERVERQAGAAAPDAIGCLRAVLADGDRV